MHLYGKTIDVILTAENQSYVRIKKRIANAPGSSWTRKNTFGVITDGFTKLVCFVRTIRGYNCICQISTELTDRFNKDMKSGEDCQGHI
jgi:hypothetical protein